MECKSYGGGAGKAEILLFSSYVLEILQHSNFGFKVDQENVYKHGLIKKNIVVKTSYLKKHPSGLHLSN